MNSSSPVPGNGAPYVLMGFVFLSTVLGTLGADASPGEIGLPGTPELGERQPDPCEEAEIAPSLRERVKEWDQDEEEEVQTLRERLTEREDEIRVEKPWVVDVFDRPLSVLGQYELVLEYIDELALGETTNEFEQLLLEQELEIESFYPLTPTLSVFVQGRLIYQGDLDADTPDAVSDLFVERGEAWVYWEELFGQPIVVEAGRLEFEDDRLWWWDEDLDAVRLAYDPEPFGIELSIARELAPARTDRGFIEPEDNQVLRVIAEAGWEWHPEHEVKLFVLYHDDRSPTQRAGDTLRLDREDESDAELVWVGARAAGAFQTRRGDIIGYWLDAAGVYGDETLILPAESELEEEAGPAEVPPPGKAFVEETRSLDVRGWGLDTGVTWALASAMVPRITVAYALSSGDGNSDNDTDRAFRQTGLQGNEPGFGGVQRFKAYGFLLDPELSNLSIVTTGVGVSLFETSSLDLLYHYYHLVERADALRDAEIDAELTGRQRDLGQGVEIVLAVEEWDHMEFEVTASAFRPGPAFGRDNGDWAYGGFFAVRFAF